MKRTPHVLIGLGFVAIGLVTVILGFVAGGTPAQARREARDQLRSGGLSNVSGSVNSFYTMQNRLPTQDEYQSFYSDRTRLWLDGNHPFLSDHPSYRAINPTSYELCTTFESERKNTVNTIGMEPATISKPGVYSYPATESPSFWDHPVGKTCYSVVIPYYTLEEAHRRFTTTSTSTTP